MRAAALLGGGSPRARVVRWCGWALVAVVIFVALMAFYRKDPWTALVDMYQGTVGSGLGWGQVLETMIPILFCAMAVTIPARIGQVNVGGEGQLWIGGACAAGVALYGPDWPQWLMLTAMALAGMAGGALFAGIPGWLKARGWMNEVFSTVLLNYVGILVVSALVFGPWHDPRSGNYPQSRALRPAAWLPHFGSSGVDVTLIAAIAVIAGFELVLRTTRFGLEIRAIGGNPNAAQRLGVPVGTFIVVTMCVGGALAGLAGMGQLAAVQLRLNQSLSPPVGFGYLGFLVSWLAGHNPRLIVPMALLISILSTAGLALGVTLGVPLELTNVLAAAVMLVVLVGRSVEAKMAWAR